MSEQLNAEGKGSKERKTYHLPLRYWPPRIFLALLLLAGSISIIGVTLFSFVIPYTFTDAMYVKQLITRSDAGSHQPEVEVRFGTETHKMITAYIDPGSNHLQRKRPIPIIYQNSDPQNVFYATSGDQVVIPLFFSIGGTALLAAIGFFISATSWRRRIVALANQAGNWQPVYLYRWRNLRIERNCASGGGSRYTWPVFRRTFPSKQSQCTPDVSPAQRNQSDGDPSRGASLPAPQVV